MLVLHTKQRRRWPESVSAHYTAIRKTRSLWNGTRQNAKALWSSMDELYRAHANMIYRYLLALSGNAHTATE